MEMLSGRVIKGVSGLFTVRFSSDGGAREIVCKSLGRVKREGQIVPGDIVSFYIEGDHGVIKSVMPRKGFCIRPAISNLTQLVITIAPSPLPDFLLVDKMLITAHSEGIKSVICVTKSDHETAADLYSYVLSAYKDAADDIVLCSYSGEGIDRLTALLNGEVSCFCGQSAAGKSSLISAITGLTLETGELSRKSGRGKHTTRHTVLIPIGDDGYIADTPGFSLLEVDAKAAELYSYYADYLVYQNDCRFNSCTHTLEPSCAVKEAVDKKLLDNGRYQRYLAIFEEIKAIKR